MKLKLTLIVALSLLSGIAFSQKKGQLFGLHYNMADFNSTSGVKDPLAPKGYSKVRDMNKGLSISYWRGLTSKVDLSVKANVIFRDYSAIYQGISGKTEVGIELEPALNARLFPDAAKISPFITAGAGVGMYNNKFGGYIPAGVGLQFNFESVTYLFIQAQYKFTLTPKVLGDNLFYSIGFAQKF
jgi:OmpA-OmpF porin, OOP family